MKAYFRSLTALVAALLLLPACKGGLSFRYDEVTISGKAGEVLVVSTRSLWDGEVGRTLADSLGSECSFVLGEPLFSLIHVIPSGFGKTFKLHRNILEFVVDGSIEEGEVLYLKDLWARPQCVIRIQAKNEAEALRLLKEESPRIITSFEQAERNRIVSNCKNPKYEDSALSVPVTERLGGSPHFTRGFQIKKTADDFVWISDEKQFVQQGFLLYSYPAGENALSRDSLLLHTAQMMEQQIPGQIEGSYMAISDYEEVIPTMRSLSYQGRNFQQIRGYWDVTGDYMGGPFVEHAFLSPDGSRVILLLGYVYSPKLEKRQYLRQVESVLYSFDWKK